MRRLPTTGAAVLAAAITLTGGCDALTGAGVKRRIALRQLAAAEARIGEIRAIHAEQIEMLGNRLAAAGGCGALEQTPAFEGRNRSRIRRRETRYEAWFSGCRQSLELAVAIRTRGQEVAAAYDSMALSDQLDAMREALNEANATELAPIRQDGFHDQVFDTLVDIMVRVRTRDTEGAAAEAIEHTRIRRDLVRVTTDPAKVQSWWERRRGPFERWILNMERMIAGGHVEAAL